MVHIFLFIDEVSTTKFEDSLAMLEKDLIKEVKINLLPIAEPDNQSTTKNIFFIKNNQIHFPLDWFSNHGALILKSIALNHTTLNQLINLILKKWDEGDKNLASIHADELLTFKLMNVILWKNKKISSDLIPRIRKYSLHNLAVLYHFGLIENNISFEDLTKLYFGQYDTTKGEEKLLTGLHFAQLLLDANCFEEAHSFVNTVPKKGQSEKIRVAFQKFFTISQIGLTNSSTSEDTLDEVKNNLKDILEFYKKASSDENISFILINFINISILKKDFTGALSHANYGLKYFKEVEDDFYICEFILQKAHIFQDWAFQGNPQFFTHSVQEFHKALKFKTEEKFPNDFALIHSMLGLVYSEMTFDDEKKAIWAAFSASSFEKALNIFSQKNEPFQYARTLHNYATAIITYPPSKRGDNFAKSYSMFEKALEIRKADIYPEERSLTLLNQLKLCWLLHNNNKESERKRFATIEEKANEVICLSDDSKKTELAEVYLNNLKKIEI